MMQSQQAQTALQFFGMIQDKQLTQFPFHAFLSVCQTNQNSVLLFLPDQITFTFKFGAIFNE